SPDDFARSSRYAGEIGVRDADSNSRKDGRMRNASKGKPLARLGLRARTVRAWSLVTVLAALLIGAQKRGAQAQEVLRWKLKAGDVLKYTTEQKIVMSVKVMGRDRKQTRTQTIHYSWNIKTVSNDGLAEIVQRIERLSMRVEAPPYMPFEF